MGQEDGTAHSEAVSTIPWSKMADVFQEAANYIRAIETKLEGTQTKLAEAEAEIKRLNLRLIEKEDREQRVKASLATSKKV